MSESELKDIIADCCNDVIFAYNGKKSGVSSEVKPYNNVEDVMNDKFYSGKSIIDLIGVVEFTFV